MFSTNSFNTCPHCGKANALNARYCSSCGKHLEAPEAIVVCKKCHKVNSALASFCGQCGHPLQVNGQTKICPRCHSEVGVTENACKCGYSFTSYKYAAPEQPVSAKDKKAAAKAHNKKIPHTKNGGRGIAVLALVFLLVFAYLLIVPACVIRPDVIVSFDGGLLASGNGQLYVYDLVLGIVNGFMGGDIGAVFTGLVDNFGAAGLIILALSLITAVTMVAHLIVCIVRIFSSKRSKKFNIYFLIMAIISTICVGLFAGFYFFGSEVEGFLFQIYNIFVPANYTVGWVYYVIPVYFWFFFIFSVCAKRKKLKKGILE